MREKAESREKERAKKEEREVCFTYFRVLLITR